MGCSSGERRYQLTGKVTYKGKPVPEGYIIFEPNAAKGNKGGPGQCKIIDGVYDTRLDAGTGTLGGPHLITITGFDKKVTGATAREVALPKSLFTDYKLEQDLPKKNSTLDIDVP